MAAQSVSESVESAELPDLSTLLACMRVVSLPMNTKFRGVTYREAALFEAPQGWVEFSPFLEYGPRESATWLASALEAGWSRPPLERRSVIPVNATLPAVAPSEVSRVMDRYGDLTFLHTVKVKVAEENTDSSDDVARLQALRAYVGDNVRIRIDVNGKWNVAQATKAIESLQGFDLEYVEQPVATVEDLARVKEELAARQVETPIAADESIRKSDDPLRVAKLGAADLIIVKAQPLGGARRVLDVVRQTGLAAVVSSALDTPVGIAFGARIAAALPNLDHACGLGTGALFSAGLTSVSDTLAPGNVTDFQTIAGWPVPTQAKLGELAASKEREQWWRERVAACYQVLAAR